VGEDDYAARESVRVCGCLGQGSEVGEQLHVVATERLVARGENEARSL
jgi:hypothetical protein